MRLLLIRHGQTPGNVLGQLDTAHPGPGLRARFTEPLLDLEPRASTQPGKFTTHCRQPSSGRRRLGGRSSGCAIRVRHLNAKIHKVAESIAVAHVTVNVWSATLTAELTRYETRIV